MADSNSNPLHHSSEVEDFTHLTEKDKKHIVEDAKTAQSSLHRSEEKEDLAHVLPQDANKPLYTGETK